MMIVEQSVEWRLAGESEVLGENLPQLHFVHHKSHFTCPGARTRAARRGKPATNRLICGAAQYSSTSMLTTFCWQFHILTRFNFIKALFSYKS
jgi:hypothetical protein